MTEKILAIVLIFLFTGFIPGFSDASLIEGVERPVTVKEGRTYLGGYGDLEEELLSEKKDFLEINLLDAKARIYKKGKLENTFSILHSKNGLPSGFFRVQSKKESFFSMGAGVYLPYVLNYYGSCQIHGEVYGYLPQNILKQREAECVALENRDAKLLYKAASIGLPVLVINKDSAKDRPNPEKPAFDTSGIEARTYLVADLDSGLILAEKNSDVPYPIASLTKLMTALVLKEQVNLKNTVEVKSWMLDPYGYTRGISAGAVYSLEQLYYPLLQESSNDAAQVLSSAFPGGSAIDAMNQRAKSIMMEKTGFVDAHGIDVANQATARDLFYLARYIADFQPEIFEITKGATPAGFFPSVFPYLQNKNMFFLDPDFIGGKTGYIIESKYNGLFLFKLPQSGGKDRRVVIIVLGAPHWQTQVGNLRSEAEKLLSLVRDNQ